MKTITKELHEKVFQWLHEWSKKAALEDEINPFFATRFRQDRKFNNGFFFQGTEEYLAVTFWTGSDYMHKTPNIYFEISAKQGVRIWMVARDSELKFDFYKGLTERLEGWKKGRYGGTFIKSLSNKNEGWEKYLSDFVSGEKKVIDAEIKKLLEEVDFVEDSALSEEYVSRFGFIEPKQFDTMVSNVLSYMKRIERERKLEEVVGASFEDKKAPKDSSLKRLPVALEGVYISKYLGVLNIDISGLPETAKWIFITGENGFGKTVVLQALALGLTNHNTNYEYIQNQSTIRIGYVDNGNGPFISSAQNYSDKETFRLNHKLVAYGPARLDYIPRSGRNESGLNSNVHGILDLKSKFVNVEYELEQAHTHREADFKSLCEMIKTVTDGQISKIQVVRGEVRFFEKLPDGQLAQPLPFEHLSTGYKALINLSADILFRLSEKVDVYSYSDLQGIVIIDELENHLHPKLQKKIPAALSKVFPNVQFIASTHSAIPLLGAPIGSVFLKVIRDSSKGITLNRLMDLEENFRKLLPNAILTSELFDLERIIPDGVTIEQMDTSDTYHEFKINKELDKQLRILKEKDSEFFKKVFGNNPDETSL